MLDGIYLQSYGPSNYTAHGCYDFRAPTGVSKQAITTAGTFRSTEAAPSNITITPAKTSATISFPYMGSTLGIEAGALFSFSNASNSVLARFGVSMISATQACANAEEEVPDWKWTTVQTAAENQWSDILGAINVNTTKEDPTVLELLYSSVSPSIATFVDVGLTPILPALSHFSRPGKLYRRESILGQRAPVLRSLLQLGCLSHLAPASIFTLPDALGEHRRCIH
jgi:hypothetical protein